MLWFYRREFFSLISIDWFEWTESDRLIDWFVLMIWLIDLIARIRSHSSNHRNIFSRWALQSLDYVRNLAKYDAQLYGAHINSGYEFGYCIDVSFIDFFKNLGFEWNENYLAGAMQKYKWSETKISNNLHKILKHQISSKKSTICLIFCRFQHGDKIISKICCNKFFHFF